MKNKKIILICNECFSRNYKKDKSQNSSKLLQLKKYCKKCNKNTLHKETR